ncbi:MAG TPA: 16S rRNA (cytosine(1402)-N(4))-methyltransferase [Prolixibacteraceae bacterium]|nr:16S rRNA (cytosine(1402)-N(4))-methyltransferase [Prolixibacteraceae bacterium]
MNSYHIPVMLDECIKGLMIHPEGIYVDATFGGGGHAREIAGRLTSGRLFAFDQDEDAIRNVPKDERLIFIRSNFRYIRNFLKYYDIEEVDGIFADLGVSSHDFDEADRGFSFRFDAPLDMRMNQESDFTAAKIIEKFESGDLIRIFRDYGEIKNAHRLAGAIMAARNDKPIITTGDLQQAIQNCIPRAIEKKYLAQVFQALRMEVNQEKEVLMEFLNSALGLLKPGGRLVVLTYHSIEDRLVKNFMKSGNFEGKIDQDFYGNFISPFTLINRKVMIPSEDEIKINPRSRSAKLRIAEKKEMENGE